MPGPGIQGVGGFLIRRIVFWPHFLVGISAGVVILGLAATGALLSLQTTVLESVERRSFVDVPADRPGGRLGPYEILAAAERALVHQAATENSEARPGPPSRVISLRYRSDPRAPVRAFAGRDRYLDLDPWTGTVLATGPGNAERFFAAVERWHRWLNLGEGSVRRGRAVTGAATLAFLFLLLTGPILWWPYAWSRRSPGRSRQPGRRRTAQRSLAWHAQAGIWSCLPMGVIAVTGFVTAYPKVGDRVNPVVGQIIGARGEPIPSGDPEEERSGAGLSGALATAMSRVPGWQTLTLTLPRTDGAAVRAEIRAGGAGQPHRTLALTIAAEDGAVLGWEDFADATPGRRGQEFLRFAHTGEYWGRVGEWVAGALALVAGLMAWTGLALAVRRMRSGRRRESGQAGGEAGGEPA